VKRWLSKPVPTINLGISAEQQATPDQPSTTTNRYGQERVGFSIDIDELTPRREEG
jgi:hypothetical protein